MAAAQGAAVIPSDQGVEVIMGTKSQVPVTRESGTRLFDNFAQSFGRFPGYGSGKLVPSMNVSETDAEVEFTAEFPVEKKEVEMTLADNVLTIRGEKKAEKEEKKKDYRLVERSFGSFSRSFDPRASALRQSRQRLTRVC